VAVVVEMVDSSSIMAIHFSCCTPEMPLLKIYCRVSFASKVVTKCPNVRVCGVGGFRASQWV
jgi:hypothetical protein